MGKNFLSKIIAFLCALFIWIVVYNIYDPVITAQVKDIEVTLINESAITSLGKVYKIEEGSKISFYIKGKQSIIHSIKKSDIKAIADLSRLSDVNAVKINISIPSYSSEDIEIIYGDIDTLKVSLDNYVTKSFEVFVNAKNKISDKYYLKSNNCSNLYIKISGPQQKINKISEVYIEPNLEYVTPEYTSNLDIKAKDSFGSNINLEELNLSTKTINYKPTIYNVKEVPINLNLDITVPFGYELTGNKYSPKKIKVTGTDNSLKDFKEFNIFYSLKDLTETKKVNIDLKDYIADGLFFITNDTIIDLEISVEKLETKKYNLKISDINIKNVPESMGINYLENSDLYIEVMGNKNFIDNLVINDIIPYVDFSSLSLGKHSIKINSLNENLTVISSSFLNIELKNETIIVDSPLPIEDVDNLKDNTKEDDKEDIKEDIKEDTTKEDKEEPIKEGSETTNSDENNEVNIEEDVIKQ